MIFSSTRQPSRAAIFLSRNAKLLNYKKKNPVELKHSEISRSYRVFYLMKPKPQKER